MPIFTYVDPTNGEVVASHPFESPEDAAIYKVGLQKMLDRKLVSFISVPDRPDLDEKAIRFIVNRQAAA